MRRTISVMIVEEQQIFRECLSSALAEIEWIEVIGSDGSEKQALKRLEECQPDVMVIDQSLPERSALTLMQHVTRESPQTRLLILGITEDYWDIQECVEAGARGYILTSASLDELKKAIEMVARGEIVLSPQITYALFSQLSELARAQRRRELIKSMNLTPRELEILQMIAEGLSNKQIANHLCLSVYTIKNHVHQILEKLQVEDRKKAVEYAQKKQWL